MYYQQWMEEQAQRLVDATAAAFKAGRLGPVGATPVGSVSGGFAPPYGVPPMGELEVCMRISASRLDHREGGIGAFCGQ